MGALAAAALAWVGVHVGVAGTPLRGAIAGRVGDKAFRALFSVA